MDRLRASITRSAQVPDDKTQDFKDFFDDLGIADSSTFQFNSNAYTKDSNGNTKYLTLLSSMDPDTNKYTIFFVDIKASFHVAEDMFIWEKQSSKFGGLIQKTEQYIERRPHDLSLEETELLMSFFDMVALKHLRDQIKAILEPMTAKYAAQSGMFLE